jgi:hypothetical protein
LGLTIIAELSVAPLLCRTHLGVHLVDSIKVEHYSQKSRYPLGYLLFCLPVGLEPQVRVWPSRPALPVADAAGRLVVPRSTIDAALVGKERVGHRKPA